MESGRSIHIHYIIKTINSSSFFFEEAKRRDFKRKTRGHQMLHNNYVSSVWQMQRAYQNRNFMA